MTARHSFVDGSFLSGTALRSFVLTAAVASLVSSLGGCATATSSRAPTAAQPGAIGAVTPKEAMDRLSEGNKRFAANQDNRTPRDSSRRAELARGQHPFAVVLACSDSRVPPELVFDQDLGDLFVVRVAGNTADNVALGSMEYAVEHLGAKLIVVLGHEQCGAVSAAVQGGELPGHLSNVVADIAPMVAVAKSEPGDTVHNCVWHNVANVAARLRGSGPILRELVERGDLQVVGAVYDLDAGIVRFLPTTNDARLAHGEVRFGAP